MPAKLKNTWPFLLLILTVLSLFVPALLNPGQVLFPTFSQFSDLMVIHWPKARLMADSWQAGRALPYWTPLILSGMPLAANQLAMLFYPPAWLFLILPIEVVFNLLFIFHLLVGGLGIYFLLREGFQTSPAAALLGGLTFALNGKWLAHAAGGHVSMVGAIGWLPWAVFGMHMLLQGQGSGGAREAESRGTGGRESGGAGERRSGGVEEQGSGGAGERRSRGAEEQGSRGAGGRESGGAAFIEGPVRGQGRRTFFFTAQLFWRMRWAVLTAVALALQIMSHTLPALYSVYLTAAMVVWHFLGYIRDAWPVGDWRRLIRSQIQVMIGLATIPVLAGLLGAAQLLPLLELAPFSNRSFGLEEATLYAASPLQLIIGLLLPDIRAGHELIIYGGLVSLLLASLGLRTENRWRWFYAGIFVFSILFALGPHTPVHGLFYQFIPGFRWVRTPARMFFVGAVAAAILVGLGVEHLRQGEWSGRAGRRLARLTVGGGGAAFLAGLGLIAGFGQVNRAALVLVAFVPLGLMLILLRARRILSAQATITLLGLLLYLDLASFDLAMMRFVPLTEALAPGRPAAEYLAQKPGYFRIYSPSYSLPMQTAAAADLRLADGVEPVHLAVYDQYMARAGGYQDAGFSVPIPNFGGEPPDSALRDTEPDLKLLGLLNVKYLVSAFPMPWSGLTLEREIDSVFIYQNEQVLPRAWVAFHTIPTETNWLEQLERTPLANIATVEKGPILENTGPEPILRPPGEAIITHYAADLIEIEVGRLKEPGGWLVLSELWYPGWQATVNGEPRPVEKVNGLLRGLYLEPPGPYQITMAYRPRTIIWGRWMSGLTAGVVIVLSGWVRLNKE